MKEIIKLLKGGFESSSCKTPEFSSFAKTFRNAIKKELTSINAELTAYSVGHFYISGFFRVGAIKKCYYFSISDVRGCELQNEISMLYRTAKDEKDYTGGSNQYVTIQEGIARKMQLFPL